MLAVTLEFTFSVGQSEPHMVHFSLDQAWGFLTISVDGKPVIKDWRLISSSLTKQYRFRVGEKEPHDVVIVKERKLVGALLRSQICRVSIDGTPAGEYSAIVMTCMCAWREGLKPISSAISG
jgi:hypothetical protein